MSISGKRPNPDELLARVAEEESRARRGKLRIFFGYAAGVGKTYAMLSAAQRERTSTDLVVGYVEPHGRAETEALLAGLETLPTLSVTYRGAALNEFDLDAALARKPKLVLVDELAHTNVPGMRHPKRWQDVEELLSAGIDVWTTLNVQHIESLNDVIAQITGIAVKETLPDTVLESADEIELIDISPAKLLERLSAGKVYISSQAERALSNFFQRSNLVALRELSLRQAANRLHRDVEDARHEQSAVAPWVTSERLLVCVGPSPSSARIVRATKRLARSLGAEWTAVAVDTGVEGRRSAAIKEHTARNLQLAEQLGAETHTLIGRKVADTLLEFAQSRNVTKIVVGKTAQPRWKRWLFNTVVDELLGKSGDIDVYIVSGEEGDTPASTTYDAAPQDFHWHEYGIAAAIVTACGLLGWVARQTGAADANIVMIFLAGVALVAARLGRGPSIASAIVSVLVFDFCFVPPRGTFAVSDTQYIITFAVMLGIGFVISELTSRLQSQLRASQQQERRTGQLFRMTRQLSELAGSEFLVRTAGRQLEEIFDGEVVLYLRESGPLSLRFGEGTTIAEQPVNEVVAQWVTMHGKLAGMGTGTLPNATALFIPLAGSQQIVGALGICPKEKERLFDPEQIRLLETCGSLIALSIERDESFLKAHEAQLQVQAEQLRNSLLSSVSHDLRTPLATIAGSATILLERSADGDRELLQTVVDESGRLNRLVENLLDMARLDSGSILLNRQWHVLEEILGTALAAVQRELKDHDVRVNVPADFPLVLVDGMLLEQLFVNLLENASRYTTAGSRIEISAAAIPGRVEIRVADNGPGLPPGSERKVFDKFFRGSSVAPDGRRGVGLGLAICQAIVEAHGGEIRASNRREGGAEFTIVLPCNERPPQIRTDELPATATA